MAWEEARVASASPEFRSVEVHATVAARPRFANAHCLLMRSAIWSILPYCAEGEHAG
jgi:hypothetical protein